jgi:serine phosphatase RsbU (regulator of sigma subunit)
MTEPHDLAAHYSASLARFMETGKEDELQEAYSLGRAAFAGDVSILHLTEMHRSATVALLDLADGSAAADRLAASFAFLAEALATFEMAQRGYWEAQERARLEREQSMRLQLNLLPTAMPRVEGLDLAVRYLPGEANSHAGGDWYDVFTLDDGWVGLVVGDVSGHGVEAAAQMGQLRIAVLAYALAGNPPAAVVEKVDALLVRLGAGEIATMVYVMANPADGELMLVNAGHPPPLVIRPDGGSRPLRVGHGRLLGLPEPSEAGPRAHELSSLPLGGYLLLYTDGLLEPLERGSQDGLARLCTVTAGFTGSADELCDHVLAELTPEGANDDICIVAARLPTP